ncbi:MAG: hypothetical protein QM488_18405 [Rhizobiaceae bacterium]
MVDKFTDDLTATLQDLHDVLSPHKDVGLLMPVDGVKGFMALLESAMQLSQLQYQELDVHRQMNMEMVESVERAGGMQ